jgi:phosphatidylserine decarboxylase
MDRDGFKFFMPPLVASVAILYIYFKSFNLVYLYISYIMFLVSMFMVFFFRDPERKIPKEDGIIVSPVDGKILKVENDTQENKTMSIFLSLINVHVNRVPVAGRITDIRKSKGLYLPAYKSEAGRKNTAIETDIFTPYGLVTVRQVVGVLARRLVNRLKVGDEVQTGQRFGMMRFGSRMDLILPPKIDLLTAEGEKVKAGITVVGRFKDA